MITSLLLNAIYSFLNFLVGLLPVTGLPVAVTANVHNFFSYVYQFNNIVPIDTAFTVLKYAVDFWICVLFWELGRFIFGSVRGN